MYYSVDSEHGNEISTGMDYSTAHRCAVNYLRNNENAECAEIYSSDGSETETVSRDDI
jgi:hypothetical protein